MTSGKKGSERASSVFKLILLSLIDHPDEIVRMDIDRDRIRELADSIRERGLLQPIIVHRKGDRYGIIAGDRRYMACEILGLKKMMCCVREVTGKEIVIDRGIENLQRENLTPLEEAFIYLGLRDDEGMKVEEISKVFGKSAGVVERRLSILKMPESFQKAIHEKKVNISVAEELWGTPDNAKREYFLTMAIEHGITKEVARNWVSDYRKEKRSAEGPGEPGRRSPLAYDDVPIYRACDVCHGPCNYDEVKHLVICPGCDSLITAAVQKQS